VVTWLNVYLRWRLHDLAIENQKSQHQVELSTLSDSSELWDSSLHQPPMPSILEETQAWVKSDLSGELRQLCLKNHPHITAQYLILKRLPPETSWQLLSDELQVSISTLSSFYQRHCLPLLRNFGRNQGYI
jgi:hypothetical protein